VPAVQSTVVDAHTHIFTPDVVKGRENYVGRDLWFEHLYAAPRALLVTAARVTSVLAFATLMSAALLLPLTGMIRIPARPSADAGPRRRPALPARLPSLDGGAAAGRDLLPVAPV